MTQARNDETDGKPGEPPATGRKTLALLAASGAIALVLYAIFGRDDGGVVMPPPERETTAPSVAGVPDAAAGPEAGGIAPEAAGTAIPALEPPGFDVVRVAPDGSAVVAGRATPGSVVTVYADDLPLAETEADADGNFVAIFSAAPSEEPRALTLGSVTPNGGSSASEEVVVLLPESGPAETEEAVAADVGSGDETADQSAVADAGTSEEKAAEPEAAGAVAPEVAAAPEAEAAEAAAEAGPQVAATAILRPEGVEVALAESPVEPGAPGRRVSLASISYGESGEVSLAGLGGAGARVRAYVDDNFALETDVGSDGRWAIDLGDVAEGVYRLRIDQIDAQGRVASRIETPFQRDYPRLPPPRPGSGSRPVVVTVQPGANLWTLARVHYGSGVLYTQIFTANRDLIREPDLIYPGQILELPGAEAAE